MMPWGVVGIGTSSLLLAGGVWWVLARSRAQGHLKTVVAELERAGQAVAALLGRSSYVKTSERLRAAEIVSRSLVGARCVRWKLFASSAQRDMAVAVSGFAKDSERIVSEKNRRFVDDEIQKHESLFDRMESYPMTEAQRRACVVNDDTNLVIAGAGTGKTSTMVGRAGYLLASSRAQPDDLLMLAYGKKAAEEMQERVSQRVEEWGLSVPPKIKTFHALGLEIIGAVEGNRPAVSSLATDDHARTRFVDKAIMEMCEEDGFRENLIRYLGSEQFPYRTPFDFASIGEYYEYVRTNELRTLKGGLVKSFEECVIANFLSANSVQYEYECSYEVKTAGPDYRQYRPDFYLPEYGIYIEHFALDENKRPPSHFDQERYMEGVKWKRELHAKHRTKLIETYSHLKRSGKLESHLVEELERAGIELKPKSSKEILEDLREGSAISEFSKTLCNFLVLFRQSEYRMPELIEKARADIDSSRLLLLMDLFSPVLRAYEAELHRNGEIDFSDMIRRAITYVESEKYASPYSHIMIDEFQDISALRARLLDALSNQHSDCVLFMVGDDWQSIYRFTGSDVSYMRDHGEYYGNVAVTPLDLTFRFSEELARVSSRFVLSNPGQISKTICSRLVNSKPAISMVRVVRDADGLDVALDTIAARSKNGGAERSSVLVLGRYRFVVDDTDVRGACSRHPSLDVQAMTVHAAKGKEADFVVILGLKRGKYGFPCEKPDDPVLAFLLPEKEQFEYAEERRLFYVAMTRARRRVYLVYNPEEPSRFVQEMLAADYKSDICTDDMPAWLVLDDQRSVTCPQCKTGLLFVKKAPSGDFVGCNNYPSCRYTEPACPQCDGLMTRSALFRECTTLGCGVRVPICLHCSGSMVERNGPFGRFWGCVNYRGKEERFSCTYTMKMG